MRNEIHGGMRLGIDRDPGCVESFLAPEPQKLAAELVVPDPRDVRNARALTGGRDRTIHGVAAKALKISARRLRNLAELVKRFAERNDVDCGHGHTGAAAAI